MRVQRAVAMGKEVGRYGGYHELFDEGRREVRDEVLGEVEEVEVLEAVGVGGGNGAGAGGGEFAGELGEVFRRGCGRAGEDVDGGVVDKVVGTEAGRVDTAGDEVEAAEGVEEFCGECRAIYSRQQGQYRFCISPRTRLT